MSAESDCTYRDILISVLFRQTMFCRKPFWFLRMLTLFNSEQPKLHRVLAVLSAIGLNDLMFRNFSFSDCKNHGIDQTSILFSAWIKMEH